MPIYKYILLSFTLLMKEQIYVIHIRRTEAIDTKPKQNKYSHLVHLVFCRHIPITPWSNFPVDRASPWNELVESPIVMNSNLQQVNIIHKSAIVLNRIYASCPKPSRECLKWTRGLFL